MTEHELDITGKVCPFCLLIVKKELVKLEPMDELIVKCDHPPAAKDSIPYAMIKAEYPFIVKELKPGLWELRIQKN
ncbi:MAG: sulfurtransferase TusA family protein [Promethearchaeota archaeon]